MFNDAARRIRITVPLLLLEAGLVVAWSSGFVGARFSIEHAPAMLVVFWRCVLVLLLLFPFVVRQLLQASTATILRGMGIGLLAMSGWYRNTLMHRWLWALLVVPSPFHPDARSQRSLP